MNKNKLWLQNYDNWNKDNNMNMLQIQIEFYEKRNEQISSSAISEMISESHYILLRADKQYLHSDGDINIALSIFFFRIFKSSIPVCRSTPAILWMLCIPRITITASNNKPRLISSFNESCISLHQKSITLLHYSGIMNYVVQVHATIRCTKASLKIYVEGTMTVFGRCLVDVAVAA